MRRRSSGGGLRRGTRSGFFGSISNTLQEDAGSVEDTQEPEEIDDGDMTDEEETEKNQRDPNVNPYWIEDRDLKNGPVDFLPGVELQFWKDLIEKYLTPLAKDAEKQKKQAQGLKDLRDQMVFSFFMLNAIFVVVTFLLQQQKETLFIRWPLGAKANVTYVGPKEQPVVEVSYEYLELEPIGLVFVLFFALVLIVQIIGMLFHRWGTISQIISTTKLSFCERKPKDTTDSGRVNKDAINFAKALQRERKSEEEERIKRDGGPGGPAGAGRRNTVHNLMRAQTKKQKEETMDLEKRFRTRFQSISQQELERSDNPVLRRMSMRKGTFMELQNRRDSYIDGHRRRSTVKFERRMSQLGMDPGITNGSMDSDFADDYSGSAYSFGSQHLEAVDDEDEIRTATTAF